MTLKDKIAIVTGGGSGIGKAVVEAFCNAGAKVVIADINTDSEQLAMQLAKQGGNVKFVQTDISRAESVQNLVNQTVDHYGRLDIMVANAGVSEKKAPVHELDIENWQRVLNIDLNGVMLCNKYAAGQMLKNGGGAIINMASILGVVGQENSNAYSASKAAVINFTRSVALTYAKHSIRANSVAPGYVNTHLLQSLPKDVTDHMLSKMPIGRLAEPEEIANVVTFIASDKASIITGACINADGGYTAI